MKAALARVADVTEQVRGVSYGKEDASATPRPGYLPVLRAGNITDEGLSFDDLVFVPAERISPRQRIRKHDIVIAVSSGSLDVVGKAARALAEFDGGFGAFCKVLRPSSEVDPAYFAHFFKTQDYRRRVSALAAGININNLRNEHLDEMEIPLPPLLEQRRIAEALDRAEALRAKRRVALSQLDTVPQAIFVDMFGDPHDNSRCWPQKRLDSACRLVNGRAFKLEEWEESGIPIIRIQNLNDAAKPFNYTTESLPEKFRVRAGDILFSWSGTPGTSFGCFRWTGPEGWLNQHIFNVRLNGSLDGEFFIVHVNLKLGELIGKAHGGVGLQHVTKGMIDETMLMVPPVAIQRKFAHRIAATEEVKASHRASLSELDALFASLQHRAFRGTL